MQGGQKNLEKEHSWRTHTSRFQNLLQSCSNQDSYTMALTSVAQAGRCPAERKVADSIPSQGTMPGLWANSLGRVCVGGN